MEESGLDKGMIAGAAADGANSTKCLNAGLQLLESNNSIVYHTIKNYSATRFVFDNMLLMY